MWKYRSLLPEIKEHCLVSLGEGNTPLVASGKIAASLGLRHLYFKLESLNPSGSYKDRFASAFISLMKSRGQKLCIATSSGNTGAALAAYSAAAGMDCVLVVVDGAPLPKIRQMQLYGARVCMVEGFGKSPEISGEVFKLLEKFTLSMKTPLPISAYRFCPDGMEGVQTMAYELLDSPEAAPEHVFCPAGGGGLTLAVAKGVISWGRLHNPGSLPKVHCVQPEGNDTIATPLREGGLVAQPAQFASTSISGLQVPNILDGDEVIRVCRSLNGSGFTVKDQDIYYWHRRLAQEEGIFAEPAGAVALAGLAKAVEEGRVGADEKIACIVTGNGFKDMASVERNFELPDIRGIPVDALHGIVENIQIR